MVILSEKHLFSARHVTFIELFKSIFVLKSKFNEGYFCLFTASVMKSILFFWLEWLSVYVFFCLVHLDVSIFFYVGPPKEDIFLTTFYGLYFSHHMVTFTYSWWTSEGNFQITDHTKATKSSKSMYMYVNLFLTFRSWAPSCRPLNLPRNQKVPKKFAFPTKLSFAVL